MPGLQPPRSRESREVTTRPTSFQSCRILVWSWLILMATGFFLLSYIIKSYSYRLKLLWLLFTDGQNPYCLFALDFGTSRCGWNRNVIIECRCPETAIFIATYCREAREKEERVQWKGFLKMEAGRVFKGILFRGCHAKITGQGSHWHQKMLWQFYSENCLTLY